MTEHEGCGAVSRPRRAGGAAGGGGRRGRSRPPTRCWSASRRPASAITMSCRAAARFRARPAASSVTRSPARLPRSGAAVPATRVGEAVVIYQAAVLRLLPLLPERPAGSLPQQPRAGRAGRRRLRRICLRARAQCRADPAWRGHDDGGACGLSGRHQRACDARCRAARRRGRPCSSPVRAAGSDCTRSRWRRACRRG